jgi:hypothetical protein
LKVQAISHDLIDERHNSFYQELISILLVFFIIYDIEFSFLPYLTTARISFFVLLIVTFNKLKFDSNFFWGSVIFGSIFLYSLIQSYFSSEPTQSLRIFWFVLYGWILPSILCSYINRASQFFNFLFIAVSIQAVLVILMFFNLEIRTQVLQLIRVATNITDESSFQRAFGFTSLTGATFSIVQSLGFFAGVYQLKVNANNIAPYKKLLQWLALIIILLSTFLIGRTGVLMALGFATYYFLFVSGVKGKLITLLLVFLLLQLNIGLFFINITESVSGFNPEWFIEWIQEGFVLKNNYTVQYLNTMYVPPFNDETVVGLGRVEAENGIGNASLNDSGYIQTYYSLGFFMSFVFYGSYLVLSVDRWIVGNRDLFILFLLILTFVIEYKEPFIFKYSLPFVLTTILLYGAKEN